jgi:hypothetical protein
LAGFEVTLIGRFWVTAEAFFWKDMNWIRDHWKGTIVIRESSRQRMPDAPWTTEPRQLSSQTMALASSTSSRQRLRVLPEIALQ